MKVNLLAMCAASLIAASPATYAYNTGRSSWEYFQQETRQVSGKITDQDTGSPIEGVSVSVKGSGKSVLTDAEGRYSLTVREGENVLIFSHVGYLRQEVKIGSLSTVNLALAKDQKVMDDVVVIGYGTQRARDITGSIVSVDMKKLQDIPVPTVAEALRGQVPNLNVSGGATRPGTMPTINVRQQFNWGKDGGNEAPLIIIDDMIQLEPNGGLSSLERFNLLDMSEVESITVLRDASAAIYGFRASQGAIVIKTKRGKAGPPRITYNGKFETMDAVSHGKVMNAQEYGIFTNRFGRANGWTDANLYSDAELASMANLKYDWLRNDWRRSNAYQQSVEVNGGSERATYFTGASYFNQGANLGSQDYGRWTFRAGSDIRVVNNLRLGAVLSANNSNLEKSFTKININDAYAIGGEQNDYGILLHMPQYIPWVYNINGVDRFISPSLGPHRVGNPTGNNALSNWNYYALLDNGSKTTTKTFNYTANFSLQYEVPFIKGLSFKTTYAVGSNSGNTEQVMMPQELVRSLNMNTAGYHLYTDSTSWDNPAINRSNSRVTYSSTVGRNQQANFFVNYDRTFGDHKLDAMFSAEKIKNEFEERFLIYENPIRGAYNGTSNSAGTLSTSNSYTNRSENGSLSYLGRVNYSYKGRYFAQFVFRSDASTIFAPENYWAFFPGVSAGWIISDEDWFANSISWVDFLKIRAAFGKTGNNNVKAWRWRQLFKAETDKGMVFGPNGGNYTMGITPEVTPNRHLKWDATFQRNFGLDLGILNNRLSLTIDGYLNKTKDMLTDMTGELGVPVTVGGAFAEQNYASIKFWGAEFSATWKESIKDFSYSIGANFAYNDNKILKQVTRPFDYPSKTTTRREEGQSTYGPEWGFRTWKQTSGGDGVLRTDEDIDNYWAYLTNLANASGIPGAAPKFLGITDKTGLKKGMLVYEDIAGDLDPEKRTVAGPNGVIDKEQDYVKLKNSNRTYAVTTNLSASWKGISLMAQIVTSWGGLRTIDFIQQRTGSTQSMWAHPIFLNDMYDPIDNPNGKYPNIGYPNVLNNYRSDFYQLSSFRAYVRTLSIGYSLPRNLVRKASIESARVYIAGNNLWDFYNPYPNKYRNMYDAPNVGYPTMRTWALGVNLGF